MLTSVLLCLAQSLLYIRNYDWHAVCANKKHVNTQRYPLANDSFSNQVVYSRSFPLPWKVKASEGSVQVFIVSEGMQKLQKNNIPELDTHTFEKLRKCVIKFWVESIRCVMIKIGRITRPSNTTPSLSLYIYICIYIYIISSVKHVYSCVWRTSVCFDWYIVFFLVLSAN